MLVGLERWSPNVGHIRHCVQTQPVDYHREDGQDRPNLLQDQNTRAPNLPQDIGLLLQQCIVCSGQLLNPPNHLD